MDIDDASDLNSGRAVTKSQHSHIGMAKGTGMPEGVKSVQILVEIDQDAFWDLHVDMLSD